MSNIQNLGFHTLTALELLGTGAFAVSGVISAMRKNMDVVGIVVCGFLAAFGGGTLRDVLIDRRPFFWVDHQLVLMGVLLLCAACASFFQQRDLESREKLLQVPDAIGLGLFCATGLHLSWTMGQPPGVAIMMGCDYGNVWRGVARHGLQRDPQLVPRPSTLRHLCRGGRVGLRAFALAGRAASVGAGRVCLDDYRYALVSPLAKYHITRHSHAMMAAD